MAESKQGLPDRLEAAFWRYLNRSLPRTRGGDYVSALLWFIRTQGRLPRRSGQLFNDRLFAIKTSSEILDPLRVFTSDKELVKLYVKARVGDEFNVPTTAVLRSPEECMAFEFPHRCVIKPTHMSGTVVLRRSGEPVDMSKLTGWFRTNLYLESREANYRYLVPKVIVEPFVFGDENPNDYKVFCFRGRPAFIQVDIDRHTGHLRNFYDCNWVRQPFSMTYPPSTADAPRPANLDRILSLASALSSDFEFVRVDFYSNGEHALVGELTHCHHGAREPFVPREGEARATRLLLGAAEVL